MNYATIGTSWICRSFIEGARLTNKLKFVAAYSRNYETGVSFVSCDKDVTIYTDLELMAKGPKIDIVYIASPNSLHFEQALLFLQNGKHVICEKPLVANVLQFETLTSLAKKNNLFIFEAIRSLYDPNFQVLKSSLSRVGTIRQVVLQYGQYSSKCDIFMSGDEPNVFSAKFAGGVLVDLGVYPIFLAVSLFGVPFKTSYFPQILRTGVDGIGTLILEYSNFNCTIICSKITHSTSPSEIQGDDGTIQLKNLGTLEDLTFIDRRTKKKSLLPAKSVENNMVWEAEEMHRIISQNDQATYAYYTEISKQVLQITEKSRRENGIIFEGEK